MKAAVHIQAAARGECTYLKKASFTTPFKVANITEDKKAAALHLMLMSASPGILDGDEYDFTIEVEAGCSLQLHTQAYQRIFHMQQGAIQQMKVDLAVGASFCYLPHPSVPHAQSVFTACNDFYLDAGCRLVFGEVLTCGRKLNGETFLLSKYHSITNIYINNRLVIKENLLMQPGFIAPGGIGQLEGFTHQASMMWLQEDTDSKAIKEKVISLLAAETGIEAGITAAPANGLLIRLLGHGAEQLYNCLQRINAILPVQKNKLLSYVS